MGFSHRTRYLVPASTRPNISPTYNELSRLTTSAYGSTQTALSGSGKYSKLAVIGGVLIYTAPLAAAAFTLSGGLRVISGVTAAASAISIIPIRTTDGVSSVAWIV